MDDSDAPVAGDSDAPVAGDNDASAAGDMDPPVAGDMDGSDPVAVLRDRIRDVGDLPVAQRVPRFEAANDVLSAALAELDEV